MPTSSIDKDIQLLPRVNGRGGFQSEDHLENARVHALGAVAGEVALGNHVRFHAHKAERQLAAATVIATYSFSHRGNSAPTVRSVILPPPNVTLLTLADEAGAPAISRDGSNLVFVGTSEGRQMLFLRPLDSAITKALPGTEGAKFPFWSSDGKSIGFFLTSNSSAWISREVHPRA